MDSLGIPLEAPFVELGFADGPLQLLHPAGMTFVQLASHSALTGGFLKGKVGIPKRES